MKTLFLTTVITLSTALTANASFMHEECRNAEGNIITKSGHISPLVIVHEHLPSTDHQGSINPVELDFHKLNIKYSEEKVISTKTTNGCVPGQRYGFFSSDTTSASKITITNKDGSEFPWEFQNRSQDGLTIEDYVICKSHISSQTLCE